MIVNYKNKIIIYNRKFFITYCMPGTVAREKNLGAKIAPWFTCQ